jgi:penicillin-binding protein 2
MSKLFEDTLDELPSLPPGGESDFFADKKIDDTSIFVDDTFSNWRMGRNKDSKNNRLGVSITKQKIRLILLFLLLGLVAIIARAAQMQLLKGQYYTTLAESNRSRIEWLPAERGVMFDRSGVPLVNNVPRFTMAIVPTDLPRDLTEQRQLLTQAADILDLNPRDIEEKITNKEKISRSIPVAENISYEQAILTEILSADYPAIQLIKGVKRQYLLSETTNSLSHLIGYESNVNERDLENSDYLLTDYIGRSGLEKFYEKDLRGTYGRRRIEIDVLGRKKTVIAEKESVSGKSLELAIDAKLQTEAQKILQNRLRILNRRRGSVIVMQPNSGEILALVSLPSFDNNLFARGISTAEYSALSQDSDHPLFPRAIGAALPSGSTFKLVIAAAALAENIITPRTTFLSTGGIALNNWFFPDWKAGGHGSTNLIKAISESVNTYFYIIGGGYEKQEGLGVERIINYARRFGFGQKTGIDLPGEGEGFLPSKEWKETTKGERWYIGDTYHLAIGQGDILVTPLQIAAMTAVIANGGKLVEPHLVRAFISEDKQREEQKIVTLNEQVVPTEVIQQIRLGMRDSVLNGSSRALSLLPVTAGGKTGTAQWHSTKNTHAWFTSFAPFEEPEIVVTVIIEEGGEGSVAAAPIARDIIDYYFKNKTAL